MWRYKSREVNKKKNLQHVDEYKYSRHIDSDENHDRKKLIAHKMIKLFKPDNHEAEPEKKSEMHTHIESLEKNLDLHF